MGGPRIITEQTRQTMRQILKEIQDGTYAKSWIKEYETGREWFEATRDKEQKQQIEQVGAQLRSMMKFLDPVTIKERGKQASVPA